MKYLMWLLPIAVLWIWFAIYQFIVPAQQAAWWQFPLALTAVCTFFASLLKTLGWYARNSTNWS